MEVEPQVPSLRDTFFHGVSVARHLLYWVGQKFFSQRLGQQTLAAVFCALSYAERIIAWANNAASEPQSGKWYVMMPIKLYLLVTRTGLELAEKYLDIRLLENQDLVNRLHHLGTFLRAVKEDVSRIAGSDAELPEFEPSSVGPVISLSSSVSSLSVEEGHLSEEEPPQPETPGDKSMYFSVEQLQEQEEGMEVLVEDDKREKAEEKAEEKSEEKAQEGKIEAGRPATAADETGTAAESTEQPQPAQPQARAPADCLVSAEEAERAAMGALPQPSAQPASSRDFVAAEGSSRPKPYTRKPARRTKRPSKKALLVSLFGSNMF